MKKSSKRRVREDVEERPDRVAKKALRRTDDEGEKKLARPEGLLVKKLGDKYQLRAEISDFTGKDEFVLQRWVKTKNKGWARTKARLGIPLGEARDLADCIGAAVDELVPRKKRRRED